MRDSDKLPAVIRFYRLIWRIWKQRRFRRFLEVIRPEHAERLLDIGGYPFNWYLRGHVVGHVDVLNLNLEEISGLPPGSPEMRALSGDARRLPFPDSSYDIVFSNSVIEHVGGIADQEAFAREALRVGGKLWVQTPAKECPFEPHYLGLFIHWFPISWHAGLARWFSVVGITRSGDVRAIAATTRLLTRTEMHRLFPDCIIWTERLLWILPKSHVAIRTSGPRRVLTPTNCKA